MPTKTIRTAPERPTLTDAAADLRLDAATSPTEPTVPCGADEAVLTAAPPVELPAGDPADAAASPTDPPAIADAGELATNPPETELAGDVLDPALHVVVSASPEPAPAPAMSEVEAEAEPATGPSTGQSPANDHLDATPAPDATTLAAQLERLVQSVVTIEELSRRARDAAASDLAQHEGMLASQRQFEDGLAQARRIREQAEAVLARAFGREARAAAEPLVSEAGEVEHAFAQLAEAWRIRAERFLAEHPDVAALLAERQRDADEQLRQEAAAARARRLRAILAGADEALRQGLLQEARSSFQLLSREFPDETDQIESIRQRIGQQVRAEQDAAARQAMAHAVEHQARGDLEAAVNVLEAVDIQGLSREVSEDVFGRWSDTCSRMAQSAGVKLLRWAPAQGRGIILYRDLAYPNGLVVFSSLGMGALFPQGKVVTDPVILKRAREFREATALPELPGWGLAAATCATPAPGTPIRH